MLIDRTALCFSPGFLGFHSSWLHFIVHLLCEPALVQHLIGRTHRWRRCIFTMRRQNNRRWQEAWNCPLDQTQFGKRFDEDHCRTVCMATAALVFAPLYLLLLPDWTSSQPLFCWGQSRPAVIFSARPSSEHLDAHKLFPLETFVPLSKWNQNPSRRPRFSSLHHDWPLQLLLRCPLVAHGASSAICCLLVPEHCHLLTSWHCGSPGEGWWLSSPSRKIPAPS